MTSRGVGIGIATGLRKADWEPNEFYPESVSRNVVLTDEQREMLRLFER